MIEFIVARVLASILKRADGLSDDVWADIMQTIVGMLRTMNSDRTLDGRKGNVIDPPAMDALVCNTLAHTPNIHVSSNSFDTSVQGFLNTDELLRRFLREFSQ